jgi:hypothetical protein
MEVPGSKGARARRWLALGLVDGGRDTRHRAFYPRDASIRQGRGGRGPKNTTQGAMEGAY